MVPRKELRDLVNKRRDEMISEKRGVVG